MKTSTQLILLFSFWIALTLTAMVLDLKLVTHFNNGVVVLFCALAVWFFNNEEE